MRLSIITPSLNAGRYIAQAIESVDVKGDDIEHIVVDGGSTDGTLETLRRFPIFACWCSRGSGSIPRSTAASPRRPAILSACSMPTIAISPARSRLALAAFANADIDCAAGGAHVVRIGAMERPEAIQRYDDAAHKMLAWEPLLYGAPIINARLYRKSFVAHVGEFDARHTIAADRDWLIRAKLAGMRIAAIAATLYEYQEHPGSLTINRSHVNADKIRDQHLAIISSYIGDPRAAAVMRRWHAWETGRKTLSCVGRGDIAMAASAMRQGAAEQPLWPLRFLAAVPPRIAARFAR